jgi:hypothetical protein
MQMYLKANETPELIESLHPEITVFTLGNGLAYQNAMKLVKPSDLNHTSICMYRKT